MASLVLYGFVALLAVGVLYGLAVLLLPAGEQIAPPAPDVRPWTLSEEPLTSQDVVDMRLPVAMRGYRFAETDQLLDRLTHELRQRDEEINRLRGVTPHPAPSGPASYEPSYDPSALRER